jgi:hypothetical protein
MFDSSLTNWPPQTGLPRITIQPTEFPVRPIEHLPLVELIDIVQALQWVRCYRYQSCEAPNWTTTFAYHYTHRLQSELISKIVAHFETQWDFPCPSLTNAT